MSHVAERTKASWGAGGLLVACLFSFVATIQFAFAVEVVDGSQPGWWNDPNQACADIHIEALYSTPMEFVGYHFCSEGVVRIGGYSDEPIYYVIPPGYVPWDMSLRVLKIRSDDPTVDMQELRGDDEVRIEGILFATRECAGGMAAIPYGGNDEDYPTICTNFVEDLYAEITELEIVSRVPEDRACTAVDINVLYQRPYDFDGEAICFDARINVEFEGMELFPDGLEDRESLPFGISPGANAFETERQGIRTGDLIHVEGRLGIDRTCLPPNWRDAEAEFFCIPNRPLWLTNPAITLLEHIPARERCVHISLQEIYANPKAYADRMICTEGITHFHDWDVFILPEGVAFAPDLINRMEFSPWHHRGYFPDMPGQRASIAGTYYIHDYCPGRSLPQSAYEIEPYEPCAQALSIELYDIQYLTEVDPWSACDEVDVAAIYENPMQYDSRVICSEGLFATEILENGYYQHILTDDGEVLDGSRAGRIITFLPASDDLPNTPFAGSTARSRFVGYLNADDECLVVGQAALARGALTEEEYAHYCLRFSLLEVNIISARYLD